MVNIRSKTLFAFVSLIALSLVSFSQAGPAPTQWQTQAFGAVSAQWAAGSWQTISMLALFISLFLVSIGYMLSTIFGSKELKMWAKAEFLQVIASAAFVLLFLVLVQTLIIAASQISYNLAIAENIDFSLPGAAPIPVANLNEKRASPFALAQYYMDLQLSCEKQAYRAVFLFNVLIEPMERAIFPTGGMEEVSGWAFSGFVGFAYWIAHNLDFLLLVTYFQRHLLIFAEDNMLTVFLPIGIILRIIPYTRGAGGVIMSIALGLFLIYPLMYGVLLGIFPKTSCTAVPPTVYQCEANDPACSAQYIAFMNEKNNFLNVMNFYTQISSNLRTLMILALVFPMINLTFTLTFIRSILQFFGADVAEMGQGILKII